MLKSFKSLEIPDFSPKIGLEFRSCFSDTTEITEQTKLAASVLYSVKTSNDRNLSVPVSYFPRENNEWLCNLNCDYSVVSASLDHQKIKLQKGVEFHNIDKLYGWRTSMFEEQITERYLLMFQFSIHWPITNCQEIQVSFGLFIAAVDQVKSQTREHRENMDLMFAAQAQAAAVAAAQYYNAAISAAGGQPAPPGSVVNVTSPNGAVQHLHAPPPGVMPFPPTPPVLSGTPVLGAQFLVQQPPPAPQIPQHKEHSR